MPRKPRIHVRILIYRTWAIGHNIAGFEWGDEMMNPKLIKRLSLGAESCVTILLFGSLGFFHTVPSSSLTFVVAFDVSAQLKIAS